jgi:hypothetical protein
MPLSTRSGLRRAMTRMFIPLTAAVALTAGLPAAAQASTAHSASAQHAASAVLTLANSQVTQGSAPQVIYAARDMGPGSALYLQRRPASALTWQNVERLSAAATFATAPADSPGLFEYRLRAVRGDKTVAVSPPVFLTVVPASHSQDCVLCQIAEQVAPYLVGGILALIGIPS